MLWLSQQPQLFKFKYKLVQIFIDWIQKIIKQPLTLKSKTKKIKRQIQLKPQYIQYFYNKETMSLKLKFGKRKLADKKEEQQQIPNQQQKSENFAPSIPSVSKTPVFSLGAKKKGIANVYDKIKSSVNINAEQPQKEDTQNINQGGPSGNIAASKPSLNLRPNLKKNIKILPPSADRESGKNKQIGQQQKKYSQFSQVPKPTPLFRGKGRQLGIKNNSKEKVIIEESKYRGQIKNNLNVEEDSYDGRGSYDVSQPEQESIHLRPDLKRKHKIQTQGQQNRNQNVDEEASYGSFQKQKYQGNQQQIYVPIQATEVNLKPSIAQVSQGKVQKQRKRVKDLKDILNLQIDMYQDFLNISEVTSYQVYISKIKSGIVKNSSDQAFDEKTNSSAQTLPFDFQDFSNQCPQDFIKNMNASLDANIQDSLRGDDALNAFVMKVAPVIQQLIRPSSSVVMPPIFLLAFRPVFRKFITCPIPVFVYETESLGIIVIGEKLYIANDKINCALHLGRFLIAGLDSGRIAFWSGKNDKGSRVYEQVFTTIQSTNFQLPERTNNQLQRDNVFSSEYKIVSLERINNKEFYSLDMNAKLVHWRIEESVRGNYLKGIKAVDFSRTVQKGSLIGYQIKSRNTDVFISTSAGILVFNGQQITQRLEKAIDIQGFELPKRSNLVYSVYSDGSLCVFDQNYSKELFSIQLTMDTSSDLQKIIIPEIEHQNRELSILSNVYVSNIQGRVYYVKLFEKSVQQVDFSKQAELDPFSGTNQSSIINPIGKAKQKNQNSNIIFRGVHSFNGILEIVTLQNDLKCTKNTKKMAVNTEKTVNNLKNIVENNRKVLQMFETDYATM